MRETYVNETRGYQFGESGWFEPYTENRGRLFRDLQREYGRCVSRVYVDTQAGTRAVGWVFEKRMQYEGARTNRPDDSYTRSVWVELRETADSEDGAPCGQ